MDVEIIEPGLVLLDQGQGDSAYPVGIGKLFRRRMQTIRAAPDERTFYEIQSLRFKKLKGNRAHQRSMRLNDQYRLILEIEERADGNRIRVIGIGDYH